MGRGSNVATHFCPHVVALVNDVSCVPAHCAAEQREGVGPLTTAPSASYQQNVHVIVAWKRGTTMAWLASMHLKVKCVEGVISLPMVLTHFKLLQSHYRSHFKKIQLPCVGNKSKVLRNVIKKL